MSDEAQHLTLVGQCTEISEKNGWTSFAISVVGKNYPVRLQTKLPALIEQGRAVGQGVATWKYKEQQSDNVNPNTGNPYMNRYLEGVEAGASATPPTASGSSQPLPEAHHDAIAPADKDRAITRMSCLSSAAILLQGAEFETEGKRIASWLAAARAAETFVYRDIDEAIDPEDDVPF